VKRRDPRPEFRAAILGLGKRRGPAEKVKVDVRRRATSGNYLRKASKRMRPVTGWTGAPLIVTSHTWENGKKRAIGSDRTIGELCVARCLASRFVAAAAKDVSDEQEIAAIEWHGDPLVVRSAPRT
jgi:hypothetical protein